MPVMNPRRSAARSVLLAALVSCAFASRPALAQPAGNFGDIDPAWLESNRSEAARQIELLEAAYSLTPQQKEALQQEMEIRLMRQKAFEDKEMAELQELGKAAEASGDDDNSPQMKAALDKVRFIAENMPFAEESVAGWVEQSLGVANATEGRQRWEELRYRKSAQQNAADMNAEEVSTFKSDLADGRTKFEAAESPATGQPMPNGEKTDRVWPGQQAKRAERGTVVPPSVAAARPDLAPKNAKPVPPQEPPSWKEAPPPSDGSAQAVPPPTVEPVPVKRPDVKLATPPQGAAGPAQKAETKPEVAPPPPPAPPLDDWDKHVAATATKYQFDDNQMTNAQSILRDLKKRANQYRLTRSDAIAKAQLMTDAKKRDDELKTLNRPMDAMFEELKQRLEALPTADQRQRASAANPSAPKKDAPKK